ncbi:DUF4864 domain-containing protein [Aestuariicoccus sp. MJ-SS9]|uniref:DUF4864 domain-containing protein n=1 Tax=Aestuariicoccus sp. MJ-SS9 TaxID=3079855 RepID=UPI002911EFDB|nr:DUF4864 domain-containing protein [Aestuariicoccus sp. MJ-SS9]MDU8909947.1 DUF4864 domain-containing protein [Aestuariicoccus sp. MJ-SS9]
MKRWVLAILAATMVSAHSIDAQEAVAPDPRIEATIQSQIDAFLQDDLARAFTFASPMIQSLFGTPENFGLMVRRGYPMVWRPEDVRFGALREVDGALWQTVILRDAGGATHVLGYEMVLQDGEWRIAGVRILPQPDVAA